jgi:hypothetical protein
VHSQPICERNYRKEWTENSQRTKDEAPSLQSIRTVLSTVKVFGGIILPSMEIQTLVSHVSFLFQKSVGIWLSLWAIRYKAGWDYKLSGTAKAVRWSVVGIGYTLAAALPGPRLMRVVPGAIGLCFLCWPNLAYQLTRLFIEWPITEGRVGSAASDGSHSVITYSFELGRDTFGGTSTLASNEVIPYSEGQRVTVAYDPLNPDQSKVLRRPSTQM